ncbi:MAG: DUF3426 domain-containing protein [Desulfobacteraceae bacterium]|nr:DUF3426 domain-containing protein [Desulfobacteraceae bacterium]
MQLNPYIAGNPVHGHDRFIGRTDVLRDVSLTLNNPNTNAIVLFGQRRIGKTSVLMQLENELAAEKKFIPVYFDLQDKASLPLGEVLYQIAQKVSSVSGIPVPEREHFDQEGIFFRDKFIPSAIQNNNNNGLVLFFDEFDVLDQPQQGQAGASFFPYLRKWMDIAVGVQFVFVLGRRPEELSTDTMSAFKAIRSRQVSLMKKEDSSFIIRQSEKNGSLKWSNEAEERVWYWTQGHPYLTQLLCSEIWEGCIDTEQENTSGVKADQVDASIDNALEQGVNAFQWIWNGLPPAERVVMAAMAEAKEEKISQDDLSEILSHSKVRLILRELELAPETLVRWDLLRPADNGFRFAIPLLRRWVVSEKPLRRVKAELDSLEPLAENLYNTGKGFLDMGNLAEAERQLRNALNVNPNHFRARLLLGQVLIGRGKPVDAVKELEPAYEFDPSSAKSGLIGALLALAEKQKQNEQLATYNRILKIDHDQSTALEKKKSVLLQIAEKALKKDNFAAALDIYKQLDDQTGVAHVQTLLHKQELSKQIATAKNHEELEDWSSAIAIYKKLLDEFPDENEWQAKLKEAHKKMKLTEIYTRAVNILKIGDTKQAQKLFGEVIGIELDYKDALQYSIALMKVDINIMSQQTKKLQTLLETEQADRGKTEKKLETKKNRKTAIFQVLAGMSVGIFVSILIIIFLINNNPDKGSITAIEENIDYKFVENSHYGNLFVITGEVINEFSIPRKSIKVTGRILAQGKVAEEETVLCGNSLSDTELSELKLDDIKNLLNNPSGGNKKVDPGNKLSFMIVFPSRPDMEEYRIKVEESSPVQE